MMEVGSSVLAEHPQFDRSLLHAPAVSCCSRAGVNTLGCVGPQPQGSFLQHFLCIIRLPENPRKTPSKQGL